MKFTFTALLIFIVTVYGCKKQNVEYETVTQITRMEKVRADSENNGLNVDVEISYIQCPGTQLEVIRGDKEFAACIMNKHKVGDQLKTKLIWKWNSFGYYEWFVTQINECPRKIDPQDEDSYNMIEECEDYVVYEVKVGFKCKRIPTSTLIEKCPWFRKK